MHPSKLPDTVLEQALSRRGALHPLADFKAANAALIVIDMQNFFLEQVPGAAALTDRINTLAKAIRLGGGRVIWVRMSVDSDSLSSWNQFYDRLLSTERREAIIAGLEPESDGWQLAAGLRVAAEDWHAEKTRFSAFADPTNNLETRLREAGASTVLVAGTLTNVCCESTARDAMMRNFATIIVADACAAQDDAAHLSTLINFQTVFGDVLTVEEILASIDSTVRLQSRST